MEKHIVLDLETMDNTPDSAIVSIGAVEVLPEEGRLGSEFYRVVSLESSMSFGGTVSGDTVMWWMRQSDAARAALSTEGLPAHKTDIHGALDEFRTWVFSIVQPNAKGVADVDVWGNGATFDNVILSSAYRRDGLLARPWGYRNDRCYRTLRALYPQIKCPDVGVAHNALDDAKAQGLHLIELLKAARGDTWKAFAA